MISGVVVILIAWCVRVRDPVYEANFNPLSLLLTAIAESLILKEKLHIGRYQGFIFFTHNFPLNSHYLDLPNNSSFCGLIIDSILGAGLIVCGLYMVLWGKGKEAKEKARIVSTPSSPDSDTVEVVTEGDHDISKKDTLPKEQDKITSSK